MQGDSELVAIRAVGVGNFQITIPVIVLGILLSVFALFYQFERCTDRRGHCSQGRIANRGSQARVADRAGRFQHGSCGLHNIRQRRRYRQRQLEEYFCLHPVVGLGSSATFAQVAGSEDIAKLTEVLRAMVDNGGRVFDTAPGYGAAEEVAGRIARDIGINKRLFIATKVNVAGRGGGSAARSVRRWRPSGRAPSCCACTTSRRPGRPSTSGWRR